VTTVTQPTTPTEEPTPVAVPKSIQDRVKRGRKAMLRKAAQRRLCLRFWRGDTYWYITNKGILTAQNTVSNPDGSGKPAHRIRNKYNFIKPIVQGKTSAATQKVPSYQTLPTGTEPDVEFAALLARKVALFGYDQWKLRRATIKAVEYAVVCDGAYALPYFDPNVGPYTPVPNPDTGQVEMVGQGEVKVKVYFGNEVMWEPGCDFDDSPWWAVECAEPADQVMAYPYYMGGPLIPDASTSDVPTDRSDQDNMVIVTRYFERPSAKRPSGRLIYTANDRVICPPEPYPLTDPDGTVIDEPILHPLSWTVDPDDDRDQGLVEDLIDPERGIQDCLNKISEWKNLALNPQIDAPLGSQVTANDEPGRINYFPPGAQPPQVRPVPPIPPELFSFYNLLVQLMRDLAADSQAQPDPNVAAAAIQQVIELNQGRWQAFLADLAEWHSRVMRHCLTLVARHYSESRLIAIQGNNGPDLTPGFRGKDLLSQTNVRVFPESLQAVTQQAVETRATNWATLGWISPTAAMRAINAGTTEGLLESYMDDVGRMNHIIQLIKQGPQVLFSQPERWDPNAPTVNPQNGQPLLGPNGMPSMGTFVPGWMPRKFDDADVQLEVLTAWMKGNEFSRCDPGMQEAAYQVFDALTGLKQQAQAEEAARISMMAEQQGLGNAGKPQLAKPMPSMPNPNGGQDGSQG
jgi:hypothetical protein